MEWDYALFILLTVLSSVAVLLIATIGLAVLFGMMGVINLAHGEFIMLGAYVTLLSTRAGVPLVLSMLLAAVVLGIFGAIVERTIIRFLYGRLLDTLLATWGLSLALYQGAVLMFGSTTPGIGLPISSVTVGRFSMSSYFLFLIAAAVVLLAVTYLVFTRTSYGMMARAAIQHPGMASAIGIRTTRINTLTFAFGSALAGLAGGLLVPAFPATPGMGLAFVAKAFLAVVVAGPVTLTGTVLATGALGSVSGLASSFWSAVMGDVIFFAATIAVLRFYPSGITARWRTPL